VYRCTMILQSDAGHQEEKDHVYRCTIRRASRGGCECVPVQYEQTVRHQPDLREGGRVRRRVVAGCAGQAAARHAAGSFIESTPTDIEHGLPAE